jgi:hypothetical protein
MSADDIAATQQRIRELLRQLDGTPVGRELRDPAARRRRAGEALLHSGNPVLREIGAQVRDGRIRLVEALRMPAYAETFRTAARQAAERLDPAQIAAQLEELAR